MKLNFAEKMLCVGMFVSAMCAKYIKATKGGAR